MLLFRQNTDVKLLTVNRFSLEFCLSPPYHEQKTPKLVRFIMKNYKMLSGLLFAAALLTTAPSYAEVTEAPAAKPTAAPTATKPQAEKAKKAKPEEQKKEVKMAEHVLVEIKTSLSPTPIEVELNAKDAPTTVENFLKYVDEKFYDGTTFHRVIPDFMIQGGGMDKDMKEKTQKYPPIKNEAKNGLKNDKYTLAMARTGVVDSATSQFFINVNDNAFLNHTAPTNQGFGYAVFGKVTKGQEIVDKIALVKTKSSGFHQNVPVEPVMIETVRRK